MFSTIRSQIIQSLKTVILEVANTAIDIPVDPPIYKEHGDLATPCAMQLSKILKRNPLDIAEDIKNAFKKNIEFLSLNNDIACVEVVKPGFINFKLTPQAFSKILCDILNKEEKFGYTDLGQGKRVLVEFVSANPTGPLTVAHARQAAVGDVLVNILNATGHKAEREFYVNDGGNQIRTLGRSVQLRAQEFFGEEIAYPEDCYQGEYISQMAKIFIDQRKISSLQQAQAVAFEDYCVFAKDYLMEVIREDLRIFRVAFDHWSFESLVASQDKIKQTLDDLKAKGFIYEHEGALWFKSTQFGDDKDRVVKKSDGFYTYLAPDIVYHKYKYDRGFDLLVDILGPDHHGYIPRIKAAAQALGKDSSALEGLIIQLATIFREGKQLRMSTRAGEFISLREVVEEVGADAGRFFMLMRQVSQQLEFDIDLAKKQAADNPVYYIQYAFARTCSLLKKAKDEVGLYPAKTFSTLKDDAEFELIRKMGQFGDCLNICSVQLDPHTLPRYMQELSAIFHKFYDKCRIIDAQQDVACERLAIVKATQIVLKSGLKLLGVSAPEKM